MISAKIERAPYADDLEVFVWDGGFRHAFSMAPVSIEFVPIDKDKHEERKPSFVLSRDQLKQFVHALILASDQAGILEGWKNNQEELKALKAHMADMKDITERVLKTFESKKVSNE